MKDPVHGEAVVAAANFSDRYQNPQMFRATLVVSADGLPKTTVKHSRLVWATWNFHWPSEGNTLPVVVDRADPTRLRIEWRKYRQRAERHVKQAQSDAEERAIRSAYGDDG